MSKHEKHRNTEKSEKEQQFARDLVYTINHAIVCGTTDVIDPFIGNWTQKKIGSRWRLTIFPHSHDHGHDHHHHHDDHHGNSFFHGFHHWVVGEAIGDIGAIPTTLALQHYAPWAMDGIQTVTEPFLGPLFKWSSERYARQWAYEQGLPDNAPEVRARQQELYKHEVEHLPHAFVWTGAAAGLNIASQKYITRSKATIDSIALGKLSGSVGTLITVLGLRSILPHKVEQIDEWNAKNIAEPATRWVSKRFGISEDTVDKVLDEEREVRDGHHIEKRIRERKEHDEADRFVSARDAQLDSPMQMTQLIG